MDIDMEEEVRAAYESVKNIDVLDVSPGCSFCPVNAFRFVSTNSLCLSLLCRGY